MMNCCLATWDDIEVSNTNILHVQEVQKWVMARYMRSTLDHDTEL